jgi:hypothetical protein
MRVMNIVWPVNAWFLVFFWILCLYEDWPTVSQKIRTTTRGAVPGAAT